MPDLKLFTIPLSRRLLAEGIGTAVLVLVIVGSGIASHRLSTTDLGLQLLENSLATALGIGALIVMFGPVSGAHFNPLVSAVDWILGRRNGTGLSGREVGAYSLAQIVGGIAGAILANLIFSLPAAEISVQHRASVAHLAAELVATAGLIALIFVPARGGRAELPAAPVGAYVGAAFWFTGSTVFLNPAVTIGRVFSNTFTGVAPASVPWLIAAQIVGAGVGVVLVLTLLPAASRSVRQFSGAPARAGRRRSSV